MEPAFDSAIQIGKTTNLANRRMFKLKFIVIAAFLSIAMAACFGKKQVGFMLADSKSYDASLFRQNCAICHGPEANGKTLDDGTKVPSLRRGEFKFHSKSEIRKQITVGGNGMVAFRSQLSQREIDLLVDLVHDKLRAQAQ